MQTGSGEPIMFWENSGEFVLQSVAERYVPEVVEKRCYAYNLGQTTPQGLKSGSLWLRSSVFRHVAEQRRKELPRVRQIQRSWFCTIRRMIVRQTKYVPIECSKRV